MVGMTTNGAGSVPYVGDRPFARADAGVFFGRTAEADAVASHWRRHRLTVLFGASGAGLTSLVRAGIVPRIESPVVDMLPVSRVLEGSTFPVAALPEHNPHTLSLLTSWSPEEPPTKLAGLTLADFLGKRRRYAGNADAYGAARSIFFAIDQGEELLTGQIDGDRYSQPFLDQLAVALREIPELHALICVRRDYKSELAARLAAAGYPADSEFELYPLSPGAALDAVRLPLAGTGFRLARGTAEAIVGDLSGSGDRQVPEVATALLQAVAARLWRAVHAHVREITELELRRLGGVRRWLSDYCEQVIATVASDYAVEADELWSWLHDSFITGRGKRALVDEGTTETRGMPNAVVRALQDWHVLTAELRADSRWYELQHDCLIALVRRARNRFGALGPAVTFRETAADYLAAAKAATALGERELAERHVAQALSESDGHDLRLSVEAESLLANAAYGAGDLAAAEAHYRAAAALSEALRDTSLVAYLLVAIGKTLLMRGRRREAVESLYGAVARVPGDPAVQTELARALELTELAG
jgi:tetratricopeptide (TPR) repeat protein